MKRLIVVLALVTSLFGVSTVVAQESQAAQLPPLSGLKDGEPSGVWANLVIGAIQRMFCSMGGAC